MGQIYEEKEEFKIQKLVDRAQYIITEHVDEVDADELMHSLSDFINLINTNPDGVESQDLRLRLEEMDEDIEDDLDL